MLKAFTKIFALLIPLVLASSSYAASSNEVIQQINPPLGLTWNMDKTEIQQKNWQLIPDKKQIDSYTLVNTIEAPDQSVTYTAVFNKQGTLEILGMTIKLNSEDADAQAQTIENNLTQQYGKPTYTHDGESKSLGAYHYLNWGRYSTGYIAYTYYPSTKSVKVAYFAPTRTPN